MLRMAVVACALLGASAFAKGQQPGTDQPGTIRVNVNLTVLHAAVLDQSGHFVSGLEKQDFAVFLDGQPRPITVFFPARLAAVYAAEHGLHTTNARLGLTFGAGVPNDPANTRVPLQFARAVLARRDIELHTDGAGVTNVCYLADAVRALLLLATKGVAGEAYNVAKPRAFQNMIEYSDEELRLGLALALVAGLVAVAMLGTEAKGAAFGKAATPPAATAIDPGQRGRISE